MKKLYLICILSLLAIIFSGCIETRTNGRHSGQITAIEKSGVVWKTWDVYVKSDISSSQEDVYCVEDEALISQLSQFSKDRTKVVLLYRSEAIIAPWRCGKPSDIITGVEKI